MQSFWDRALHSEVFPVPGGPVKKVDLVSHGTHWDNSTRLTMKENYSVPRNHIWVNASGLHQKDGLYE